MSSHDFGEARRSLWNVGYYNYPKGNDLARKSSSELEQFFPGHRRGRWNNLEQTPSYQRSPGRRQIRRMNRTIPTKIKVEHFLSHVEKNMKENVGFGCIRSSEVSGDMPGHTKWNPFKSVNLSPKSLIVGGRSEEFKFVGAPGAIGSRSFSSCIYGAIGDHLHEKGSYGKLGDILNLHSSPDPSIGFSSSGSYNLDPALTMLRASQESWYQFAPLASSDCWVFTESVHSNDEELQL